ncbi:uncharacterized protein wde [Epargyreus clarus]|uniref:uncharacterized protein wde n=1 Tax=Epargyreus clarus TaxID=520877 RepID=UPI003C2F86C6
MTTEKIQNHTDVDEAVTDDLIKRTIQTDIPNTEIDDKEEKMECSVIESDQTNSSNESNTPIEIDDEDEKSVQKNNSPNAEVLALEENMEVEELDDALEVQELDDNMEVQELDKNVQVTELDQNTQDKVITIEEVKSPQKDAETVKTVEEEPKRICKLSNNLDIFSDEEEEDSPAVEPPKDDIPPTTEKCINIDDDDDIMLIDEVTSGKHNKEDDSVVDDDTKTSSESIEPVAENAINENLCTESVQVEEAVPSDTVELNETDAPKVVEPEQTAATDVPSSETSEVPLDKPQEAKQIKKPLLPKHFIKTCKKNLADMTRDDLEDFCVLKIVESIVDRSNLGEIKSQLKNLTKTMDECKKKCLLLSKQNKDLQVVLKSVQEEQKNGDVHVTPLKITRSVGLQVVMMVEKNNARKKSVNGVGSVPVAGNNNNGNVKQTKPSHPNTRSNKERNTNNQQIPVPRLVPAVMSTKPNQTVTHNIVPKHLLVNTSIPNGTKNSPPVQKMSEKRPRSQAVTVDLTDDEPPAKLPTMQRGGVNQTMRVSGTPPNVMQPQRFNALNMNSPRKVYIPISGAQAQNVRPGQTIMLKTVSPIAPRQRCPAPHVGKVPQNANQMRMARMQPNRHPAPLPDAMKQYQPPNWKALPPAPDLKLSKVENGIVISWRIDGYQEENHEEIASYQLYAYQETTNTPPTTALWKKIGDVKALPLPMACTLTQFMAGFKYYFAVRAVDVRTRFGPFSLPGSILLLNTM